MSADGTGAYANLQAAINASVDGDTVALLNGRFEGSGNRDLELGGRDLVMRSVSGNPTFCVVDCGGSETDPHFGLAFRSGETILCRIEGITIEAGYGADGIGAVLCENGSSPQFRNVVFSANLNPAVVSRGSAPSFEECVFAGNLDGALSCREGSYVTVTSSTFANNFNDGSGGAINILSASVVLTGCDFLGNASSSTGGALRAGTISGGPRPNLQLIDCLFDENTAAYHGGALHLEDTDFIIHESTFSSNSAGTNGGAIWCYFRSAGVVTSSVFYANSASSGAALNFGFASPTIETSIFAFNFGSPAVYCDILQGPTMPTFACTDIFGNAGGDWTECIAEQLDVDGNISLDPMFCDPSQGDFRLDPGSPCVPGQECETMGSSTIGCGAL